MSAQIEMKIQFGGNNADGWPSADMRHSTFSQMNGMAVSGVVFKVIATARPLEDGSFAAQLRVQRALGVKGTYAVEEHWEQLGVFLDAQEAVAHAKSMATDLLERKA